MGLTTETKWEGKKPLQGELDFYLLVRVEGLAICGCVVVRDTGGATPGLRRLPLHSYMRWRGSLLLYLRTKLCCRIIWRDFLRPTHPKHSSLNPRAATQHNANPRALAEVPTTKNLGTKTARRLSSGPLCASLDYESWVFVQISRGRAQFASLTSAPASTQHHEKYPAPHTTTGLN